MSENIEKLFIQDSIEKKQIAHGAKHMASRTGRVGSIKMPSDFAGKEYKKSSNTFSYNIDEIISLLSQTPLLKKIILERVDLDFQYFRSILDTTIDEIFEINKYVLETVLSELNVLKEELEKVKEKDFDKKTATGEDYSSTNILETPVVNNIEECKERVFSRLEETEKAGERMTSNVVLKRHPVINYYLYKQKIWNGYREMIAEYNERKLISEVQ